MALIIERCGEELPYHIVMLERIPRGAVRRSLFGIAAATITLAKEFSCQRNLMYGTRLSGAGLFFNAGAQLQVAHQAMQVVGVNAQLLGGFGDAATGLLQGANDQLFF